MRYTSLIKITCVALLVFLLSFCTTKENKEVEVPKEILSKEVFTKLLTDYALAESAANMNIKNAPLQRLDSIYAFNPLMEHNIRKSQYDSAIAFYSSRPDLYKKIYEEVLVALSELQTKRSPVKNDSSLK
jgi:Domain of unknown function (DUF4296)